MAQHVRKLTEAEARRIVAIRSRQSGSNSATGEVPYGSLGSARQDGSGGSAARGKLKERTLPNPEPRDASPLANEAPFYFCCGLGVMRTDGPRRKP